MVSRSLKGLGITRTPGKTGADVPTHIFTVRFSTAESGQLAALVKCTTSVLAPGVLQRTDTVLVPWPCVTVPLLEAVHW